MYYFLRFTNLAGAVREYPIGAVYARWSDANIKKNALIDQGMTGVELVETQDAGSKNIIVEVERVFAR